MKTSSRRITNAAAASAAVAVALGLTLTTIPTAAAQQQQPPPPPAPLPAPPPVPPAQLNLRRQNRTVAVGDAGTLRAALDDESVSEILLQDEGNDIDLDGAEAFPVAGPPAVIRAGRTLVIRSGSREAPSSLNFTGGPTPAIVVAREGALVFSQILLTSAKPPSAAEARSSPRGITESYAVPELGLWPSVSLEPGSEVSFFFEGGEGGLEAETRGEKERGRFLGGRRRSFAPFSPTFFFFPFSPSTTKPPHPHTSTPTPHPPPHPTHTHKKQTNKKVRLRQLNHLRLRRLRGHLRLPDGALPGRRAPSGRRAKRADACRG